VDDTQYHGLIAKTFRSIEDALAEVDPDLVEVTSTGDVLNLHMPKGIRCVLNTQRPVHQVWMAVKDQAWHFSWDPAAGRWIDDRGRNIELMAKLHDVIVEFAGVDVSFR
jgi:CyaY protein